MCLAQKLYVLSLLFVTRLLLNLLPGLCNLRMLLQESLLARLCAPRQKLLCRRGQLGCVAGSLDLLAKLFRALFRRRLVTRQRIAVGVDDKLQHVSALSPTSDQLAFPWRL